jgi:bla regulator protein blaR1
MIPSQLPYLANHLWQSTLFAAAAALLTLALQKNRAQTRYWLWLAASVKFLIPFSLLVDVGSHWGRHAAPAITPPVLSYVIDQASQPFSPLATTTAPPASPLVDWIPAVLSTFWAIGIAMLICYWCRRWRGLRAALRTASPIDLQIGVDARISPAFAEPGVFGIRRPVLLLPAGITDSLTAPQLKAIVAHELCHIRRRDNLATAIHMGVEALFWFHPLVWWLGARLMDERERACDEEVLLLGSEPQTYAESILKVCELYLESPLPCVSGVTGSNLKSRIEAIMRNRSVLGLNLGKKVILTGAGMAAFALPIIIGALSAPASLAQDTPDWQTKAGGKMAFEVASVKLSTEKQFGPLSVPLDAGDRYQPTGGYFRADVPLWNYIQFAYKLWAPAGEQQKERDRLPKWVTTDRYSIEARAAGKPTKDQFRLMVQSLLADRFKMAAHFESREAPVFALTLVKAGKLGPKLIRHADGRACGDPAAPIGSLPAGLLGGKDDAGPENYPPMCDSFVLLRRANGTMLAGYRNATIDQLAGSLSGTVGLARTLVDRTGLTGRFDFTLAWAPEPTAPPPSDAPNAASDPLGPTPLLALRDQLGLKLEGARAPVKILVIDRVEKPSEN